MSLWVNPIDKGLLSKILELAAGGWNSSELQYTISRFGWRISDPIDYCETETNHWLAFDYPTNRDEPHRRLCLPFCIFFDIEKWMAIDLADPDDPDNLDDPDVYQDMDDDLVDDAVTFTGWTLEKGAGRDRFDEIWRDGASMVRRQLGEPHLSLEGERAMFNEHFSIWRVARQRLLIVGQGEDLGSYSTNDMCAIYLIFPDRMDSFPHSADEFYEWMINGGREL